MRNLGRTEPAQGAELKLLVKIRYEQITSRTLRDRPLVDGRALSVLASGAGRPGCVGCSESRARGVVRPGGKLDIRAPLVGARGVRILSDCSARPRESPADERERSGD